MIHFLPCLCSKPQEFTSKWGSGYPGDAVTKKFLQENLSDLFGFPSIVRFSWKTAENVLEEKGIKVEFEEVKNERSRNPMPLLPSHYSEI